MADSRTFVPSLVGRSDALEAVETVLHAAMAGRSGSLVLTGESGIGKTALLERAARAADMQVLRLVGCSAESDLEFAALDSVLRGMGEWILQLPQIQANALKAVLGDAPGPPAPRLVRTGLLNLLSKAAADRPLLILVDNLDRLDLSSQRAIVFVARRLSSEPIAVLGAARTLPTALDLPRMELDPLNAVAAHELLAQHHRDLAPEVGDRVIAAAGGNPLAINELASQLDERQLAGLDTLPAVFPIGKHLQHAYESELRDLDTASRELVTLAALDESGDLRTLLSAAGRMGLDGVSVLAAAEEAGVLKSDGPSVRFRHPLIGSAAIGSSTYECRRRAHLALAAVLVHDDVADRQAAHLAAAATGPDRRLAGLLEQSALRAASHGGTAASAQMLQEAADLSVDAEERERRLLLAAEAAWFAGQPGRAAELADRAGPQKEADAARRARAVRLHGLIALGRGELRTACERLLVAADLLTETDTTGWSEAPYGISRHDQRDDTVIVLGDLLRTVYVAWAADLPEALQAGYERIRTVATEAGPPDADHPYAELLTHLAGGAYSADASAAAGQMEFLQPNLVLFGSHAAALRCLERVAGLLRRGQAIGSLPFLLAAAAPAAALAGHGETAVDMLVEAERAAEQAGQFWLVGQAAAHTAVAHGMAGRARECRGEVKRVAQLAGGENPLAAAQAQLALGLLAATEGRWEEAWTRLRPLAGPKPSHRGTALQFAADVVEAAIRRDVTSETTTLRVNVGLAAERTDHPDLHTAAAHCEAMCAAAANRDVTRVERHFLAATRMAGQSAYARGRALLSYGEWLRRNSHPSEARGPLREAAEVLASMGADGFAGRAQRELRAAGERVASTELGRAELTAQELQVAKLAALGLSNREIASQLNISPRTVGYHLYNVFPKLGISDRRQLVGLGLTDGEV